ncbi:hypothetical protein [Roseospira goensis]|uniref:Zinc ribbon domain-containing protein n=1 Tax=Roseospira goensis TaxID=391922 RepID=A0A7W6RXQ8_9PROT|nr:hypothetical protein [Roseospira goensis]MBB4284502.1 hypothetical protein [Roseospira goensis]
MLSDDLRSLHHVLCATIRGDLPRPDASRLADWDRVVANAVRQAEGLECAGAPVDGIRAIDRLMARTVGAVRAELEATATGETLPLTRADCAGLAARLARVEAGLVPPRDSGCDVIPVVDLSEAQRRAQTRITDGEVVRAMDQARRTHRGDPTACPDCGGPVPDGAALCPHCQCPMPTPADHDRPEGADARDGAA